MSSSYKEATTSIVTIADHLYPEAPGESYPMAVGFTMGGGIKTADLGATVDHIDLTVRYRLNNTDYEALRNFIQDTVNRSETPFTFTDSNGTAFTNMHYIAGLPQFRRNGTLWSGEIRMAKDMSA